MKNNYTEHRKNMLEMRFSTVNRIQELLNEKYESSESLSERLGLNPLFIKRCMRKYFPKKQVVPETRRHMELEVLPSVSEIHKEKPATKWEKLARVYGDKVRELTLQHLSAESIGATLDLPVHAVYSIRKYVGVEKPTKWLSRIEDLKILVEEGRTFREIGKKYSVSKARIGQVCSQVGIFPRHIKAQRFLDKWLPLKKEIEEKNTGGTSLNAISKEYRVYPSTMRHIFDRLGLKINEKPRIREKGFWKKQKSKLRRLVKKGVPRKEIAHKFDAGIKTINVYLWKFGITKR